jgi:TPR repeat protein
MERTLFKLTEVAPAYLCLVCKIVLSADQGYAKAQNALGDMYFFGDGVAEDDSEAMTWYRRAADQAFSEAQFSVGYPMAGYRTGALDV